MFYIAYYQTLIKNTPFPTPCLQPNKHQQHISNHHVSNQPPTSTTLLQHHVSNQTNTSPNYTSQPPNQQLQHHISNQPTNRQHQQHISNSTFQTPLLHPEKRSIIPLPTATIWHLVLSHYTLTDGHPPSLGSQPLHPYRRSSSFNWCSEPVKEFIATKAFSYVPKYLMKQS